MNRTFETSSSLQRARLFALACSLAVCVVVIKPFWIAFRLCCSRNLWFRKHTYYMFTWRVSLRLSCAICSIVTFFLT